MEFNINYLNSLIENKIEESLNLEYKSAMALDKHPGKTTEISKDISALANSDGGLIIYGISEDNDLKHIPNKLDPIKRKEFSKEWLEQIINDKIRPRIENLKIHPISMNDEDVIYVVEVNKSDTAHQADDKRYYKRFNFQSVPMYDYEIRDILNRQKHPQLDLAFSFENQHKILVVHIVNVGSIFAKYVNVNIRLPKKVVIAPEPYRLVNFEIAEFSANNTIREMVNQFAAIAQYGPSRYEPILPQRKFLLIKFTLGNFPFDHENFIEWDIFCDNANPINHRIRIAELLNS